MKSILNALLGKRVILLGAYFNGYSGVLESARGGFVVWNGGSGTAFDKGDVQSIVIKRAGDDFVYEIQIGKTKSCALF